MIKSRYASMYQISITMEGILSSYEMQDLYGMHFRLIVIFFKISQIWKPFVERLLMKLFRALFGNLIFLSWNSKMITPCRWVLSTHSSLLPPAGQLKVSGPSWPALSVSLYWSLLTTPLDQRKTKENSNRKVKNFIYKLYLAKIHS